MSPENDIIKIDKIPKKGLIQMNETSSIKTLQITIEYQNKIIKGQNKIIETYGQTIKSLEEELKRSNENMEYLIKRLYGRKNGSIQ